MSSGYCVRQGLQTYFFQAMPIDDNRCFACGALNQDGLRLTFRYSADGSTAETVFVPGERFQGWQGVVHGGIISTVLDEVMAKAAGSRGYQVLTGELTTRFKQPAPVNEPLRFTATVEAVKKKVVYVSAAVYNQSDVLIAQAASKMIVQTD